MPEQRPSPHHHAHDTPPQPLGFGRETHESGKIRSIDVVFSLDELTALKEKGALADKRVVVVDVLRATSVIVVALHYGAKEIFPLATVEEARQLKDQLGSNALLCGERGGETLPDFDLGNSPREYASEAIHGKSIILTTSNGVRTIDAARGSGEILIASALNARAVREYLLKNGGDIILAASGSMVPRSGGGVRYHAGGKEDVLLGCGLVLQGLIERKEQLKKPWIQRVADVAAPYAESPKKVLEGLQTSSWGMQMTKLDREEGIDTRGKDMEYIAKHLNAFADVPVVEGEKIILRKTV